MLSSPQAEIDTSRIQNFASPVGNCKCDSTMFGCSPAFLCGVLLVLLVEALFVMFIVLRSLEKKHPRAAAPHTSSVNVEVPENSLLFSLQGGVWIAALPVGDVKKMYTRREKALKEKTAKEQKNEQENGPKESKTSKKDALKDYIHVAPVWRFARLQGRILHLSCQGVKESILLEGCDVLAVSSSAQAGRKWAKKYPLKLHNGSRHVYGGSHDCLLYLESGWEKEAWCEVLRASARWANDTDDWYFKLKKEYQEYLQRVEIQFPYLRGRPQGGGSVTRTVAEEKERKIPKAELAAVTKKRLLWKKLTRRSLKGNKDVKYSGDDSRKALSSDEADDSSSKGASISDPKLGRAASVEDLSARGDTVGIDDITPSLTRTASNGDIAERDTTGLSQNESLERALLWTNTFFARIFFDLYHSPAVVSRISAILQRQLSKVPTPSYIGKINCTHVDLGNSPPLAQNFHLLPAESDGGWGLEADLEYYGGAILTIETRIDVRDSNAREKVVVQGLEQTLTGQADVDLLNKGLENLKTDFRIAVEEGSLSDDQRNGAAADQRNGGGTSTSNRSADVRGSEEGSKRGWMQSSITNVKAMMSRVAEQVSQVPLALTIRVVQLKGTLQVRIKPPPSDRVWFSFTEMPALELLPEPCIGDHKINSGPLGAFIVNQIKILLRDSMVAPQSEDISYSWMISEAGDWVPREVVPLAFVPDQAQYEQSNKKDRREGSVGSSRIDASGVGPSNSLPGIPFQYNREDLGFPSLPPSLRVSLASVSLPVNLSTSSSFQDLTRPLIETDELSLEESSPPESESVIVNFTDAPMPVVNYAQAQAQTASSSDSDTGSRVSEETLDLLEKQEEKSRAGRRGKVVTFGKKMGTRLEEKRRSVIEKMRDRSHQG